MLTCACFPINVVMAISGTRQIVKIF